MKSLVFGTSNRHKLQEVRAMFTPSGFCIKSLDDFDFPIELNETGKTIEENSLQKASELFALVKQDCFAEDSGLEVDALNGAPGVFSARYAEMNGSTLSNLDYLQQQMRYESERKARFKTVLTYFDSLGNYRQFEGIINGSISLKSFGQDGFGYDPVFLPDGYAQTFAEMLADQKNKISHRAIAVKKMLLFLKAKTLLT